MFHFQYSRYIRPNGVRHAVVVPLPGGGRTGDVLQLHPHGSVVQDVRVALYAVIRVRPLPLRAPGDGVAARAEERRVLRADARV